MFVGFFYLLRQRGFGVSLNEWMTLMEGLLLGLHRSTLTGFYDLCRAVLVKSEADYDKFDAAFLEYFKDVPFPEELLPDELMDWLNHPKNALEEFRAFLREQGYAEKSIDEILKMFEERLREQTEEHNGGSYWIGTGGYSNFGNAGQTGQTAGNEHRDPKQTFRTETCVLGCQGRHAGNLELKADEHTHHHHLDNKRGYYGQNKTQMQTRAAENHRHASRGSKKRGLRKAQPVGILQRPLDTVSKPELRHVDQHQGYENFVGVEFVFQ